MATSTELLTALDAAFETAEATRATLATVTATAAAAIAEAQAALERVRADHDTRVQAAAQADQQAKMALEALGDQLRERIGTSSGRVTVR